MVPPAIGSPDFDAAKHRKHLAAGLKPAVPMVFVSTTGGGIRASYWTALALQCVFESATNASCGMPIPKVYAWRSFFAASGVSGGSVGLADYVAHVVSGEHRVDWPAVHAGDDEASSMLAWLFFTDLPSALVSRTGGSDRAEILERTWERSWKNGALARRLGTADAITKDGPPVPLLLLNGTRVQDGCRLISSNLDTSAVAGLPDTTNLPNITAQLPNGNFVGTLALHASGDVAVIALADDYGPFSATPVMPFRVK